MEKLSQDYLFIKINVARNPGTPPKVLEKLSKITPFDEVGRDSRLTVDVVEDMVALLHRSIAENVSAPRSTLNKFLESEDGILRQAARNTILKRWYFPKVANNFVIRFEKQLAGLSDKEKAVAYEEMVCNVLTSPSASFYQRTYVPKSSIIREEMIQILTLRIH